MKALPLVIAALVAFSAASQRTTRRNLRAADTAVAAETSAPAMRPIVAPSAEVFRISGYDKPLRSRRETFFASNLDGGGRISRVAVTITYLDASGRMLHSRNVSVPCDIPEGETRNLSIPSWDSQQSFYFVRSTVPSRAQQATPYDVKIAVDTVFIQ
jgi:hypothetical protein